MGKSLVLVFHKESNGPLFEKIIVALKTRYRLVCIHELEQLLKEKQELKNVCHISFDDGHRSFYDVIFPVLLKHHVPVSLFISPDVISTNTNYWFQEVHDYDEKIIKEINENPPVSVNKGGLIAAGIHAELDELRSIASGGKNYLLELQQKYTITSNCCTLVSDEHFHPSQIVK